MRIIAGTYRRRTIRVPKGNVTRPTTDRTREAIFNIVSHRLDLEQSRVLDLFAGTGSLGLEAISRGALSVHFVEQNPAVIALARENADSLDTGLPCSFERADVLSFLARGVREPFNLILADPPYDLDVLAALPDKVLPFLAPGGVFILEHDRRIFFEDHPAYEQSRPYGRTIVSIFTVPES